MIRHLISSHWSRREGTPYRVLSSAASLQAPEFEGAKLPSWALGGSPLHLELSMHERPSSLQCSMFPVLHTASDTSSHLPNQANQPTSQSYEREVHCVPHVEPRTVRVWNGTDVGGWCRVAGVT